MPLAKERRGSHRWILDCDPLDELHYRRLVGEVATEVDLALGHEVTSYRLADFGSGWFSKNYKYGIEERYEKTLGFVLSDVFGALGLLDVREYYPNITTGVLASELREFGCSDSAIEDVVAWISAWNDVWDVPGLPVGPEASGILGNAALGSLDQLLRSEGIDFHRHTDDLRLYLQDPERWWGVLASIQTHLLERGFSLNSIKTKLIETPKRALRQLSDPALRRCGDLLKADEPRGIEECLELLSAMVNAEHVKGRQLRFVLKVLERKGRVEGLEALRRDAWLLDVAPKEWGGYLRELRQRKLLEPDELLAISLGTNRGRVIGRYHALLALGARSLPRDADRELEAVALSRDETTSVALRRAAAHLWSRSQGWRLAKAVDAALEVGDPQQQRALILSLKRASPGRRRNKALKKLRAAAPDWVVSANWVEFSS